MDTNQPISPRRRLQILLAIPDNQRTEAQWDEIVELEITLAPGNREDGPGRDMRTAPPASQGHPSRNKPKQQDNSNVPRGNKPPRNPRNKPPKPKTPTPT